MIPKEQKLTKKVFQKGIDMKSTRDAVGEALIEAARTNDRVVVLTADLKESTRVKGFSEEYPERFIEVGVAEQTLASVASGMANYGKIPFITSFAIFSPGRNWEQIRTTIALNDVPVKIIGAHAGFSAGLDGGNHQCLEDLAIMRAMPNMIVVAPADFEETKKAVLEAVKNRKPTYIRVQREVQPIFTSAKSPFKIGRAEVVWEDKNPQVAIIACGAQVYESLLAAKDLEKKGIECLVINCHTIKPIDERVIIRSAKTTGAVVTVEEHQQNGGLGSAVSEVLAKNFPVPIEMVAVKDSFGESGKYEELIKKHGLRKENIIEAVKEVLKRKNI
jgi:transketolase